MHNKMKMMNAGVEKKTRFDLNQHMTILVTPPSMGHRGRVEVMSNNETTRHIGFMDDPKEIQLLVDALKRLL